jgi:chromosome segregation ATPase
MSEIEVNPILTALFAATRPEDDSGTLHPIGELQQRAIASLIEQGGVDDQDANLETLAAFADTIEARVEALHAKLKEAEATAGFVDILRSHALEKLLNGPLSEKLDDASVWLDLQRDYQALKRTIRELRSERDAYESVSSSVLGVSAAVNRTLDEPSKKSGFSLRPSP